MKSSHRIISGLILAVTLLSIAKAGYTDYSVDWMILPGESYEGMDVLVVGYLTVDDLGGILPVDDFSLRIMQGSTVKKMLALTDTAMTYLNDYNDQTLLLDGLFYATLDDLDNGTYSAILSIEGVDVDHKIFKVENGETNMTVDLVALTTNNGPIMEIDYDGLLASVNVDLTLYGRSNFNNPVVITESGVSNTDIYNVPELASFNLDDYVGEDEVYAFIVYGECTSDDNIASAQLITGNTGYKTFEYDAEFSMQGADLKKGAQETLSFTLENNGSLLTQYTIELSGTLAPYATSVSAIELVPDETITETVGIDVPRTHVPVIGNLTVTIKSGSEVITSQTFEMDLTAADPVHSVTVSDVTFSQDSYFNGENVKANITIVNDGDYSETVEIEYYFEGGTHSKRTVTLDAGVSRNITIAIPADNEPTLIVTANNENLNYANSFEANIVEREHGFNFYLEENNIFSQDSFTETVGLVVENTGNVENSFMVSSSYANYEVSDKSFMLSAGESKVVNATINIPFNQDSINMTFTVCSRNNVCQEDDLSISIFKTPSELTDSESEVNVTDVSLTGTLDEGAIYTFEVTNNRLIAKNYSVAFEADNNVSLDFYPDADFIVMPGETLMVYLYATPSAAGNYEINYSISEEASQLVNGTLELVAASDLGGLTGFAVAAGSVLGVAGLVVLVLFIYFYFIRQPPEGEDDFKPVEVKKADLSKPNVKNDNKYW